MDLIGTIINELVDINISLRSPLLKTQVLASRIKNKELLDWITQELNGYADVDSVPDYRRTTGLLIGSYVVGSYQFKNQPLPTLQFGEEFDGAIRGIILEQSLESLESFSSEHNFIGRDLTAEVRQYIQASYRERNPRLVIYAARVSAPIGVVQDVLAAVRSKLLNLMLKIEEELGSQCEIENIKSMNKEITRIMNNTIINNGDGNVSNTGANSTIHANINVKKNSKTDLGSILKQHNIPDTDVDELLLIIDIEQPKAGIFGSKVKEWIQKMIGKAIDGTWQIGIGAAGALLSDAIAKYYGIIS